MLLRRIAHVSFIVTLLATAALVLTTIYWALLRAPVEKTMGVVQKIFYFHVPSAYAMYLGATACLVGSVIYLIKPNDVADSLARAGAELAVVFGFIVITTGPLWAAKAWGYFWTWDPRLTTTLLSVMLYVAYLLLRTFTGDGQAERKFSASLGILGAANLPIIHFSVQKWSGQHPTVITNKGGGLEHIDMKVALALGLITFTALAIQLLWMRTRIEIARSKISALEETLLDIEEAP